MCSLWLGNFLAFYNETQATASMHVIGEQFHSSNNQNWIATAYLLGFTVTQTLLGKFSDVFGRGRVFNATLFIFAAGSLWCALAQSMGSLIGGRVLQGIGAAGRQTVGVIVIIDLTTPYTRGFWLGFFNLSLSLGIAFGPIIGASVVDHTTWRWLFWITLILIGITFGIAATAMNYPVPHRKQNVGIVAQLKDVDWFGCLLAVLIAALVCIPIELGNKIYPWNSAPIIVMFVLAVVLSPIFVVYELKYAKNPVVDMTLFSNHNVRIACLINFLTGASNFGVIFFLPRFFLNVKNSSLITESEQLFGLTLGNGVASVFGANLISQSGQVRLVGVLGSVLYLLGSGLMLGIKATTSSALVIVFSTFWGLGIGVFYQPAMVVGPMSVKPTQVAGISGFLAFLRTMGGTFSTALLTAIFETSFTSTLRGVVPDDLLSQGLGLADNHLLYPQYSDAILRALVKAFHLGTIPTLVFGGLYGVLVILLRGLDFTPAWRKKQLEARARETEITVAEKA
ncbi:major facilitator superfamily domain-containing protein [Mycena albidolilacea]|uniref:Major facilitator superfamily domain-containing protein n=1 Tax=Mycena albidolilacea TaxID=1033008 RepID=A0AAD6ZEM7_9AGAR|nr:major facilitator superfamily domain-containing protein [Mycena albidolilacea]